MKPLTPEIEYCRATIKSWERLRLLYNLIMVFPGAAVLGRTLYLQSELMETLDRSPGFSLYPIGHPIELIALAVVFGFVANICYCLGPYSEFVITALGFPLSGQRSRLFLFGMGVMISLGVVALPWLYVEYFFVSPFIITP